MNAPDSVSDATIKVAPINPNIGAEITGIDFASPLSEAGRSTVQRALLQYEVLVFPDAQMTTDQQMQFAANFGELSIHPFSPALEDKPEVIVLDNHEDNPPFRTDSWHSDETFRETPPLGTLLRALIIPEIGGDTMFASMSCAYEGLGSRLKKHIEDLTVIHDFGPFRTLFGADPTSRKTLRDLEDRFPNPRHPVVRVHPESGRLLLNVNRQFCTDVVGLSKPESAMLLEHLYEQTTRPEYQLRVKWHPGQMVFWDNRSVLHYAVHDYMPARRSMQRVTLIGDKPFGQQDRKAPALMANPVNRPTILKAEKGGQTPRAFEMS